MLPSSIVYMPIKGDINVTAHIIKRILSMIPILIVVSIILFFLMNVLPGDAAATRYTAESSEEYIEQLREKMGLNKPAYIRYFDWVFGMIKGDFGKSLLTKQPVLEIIKLRMPVTLELALLALIIGAIIAIPLGIVSALNRNKPIDLVASFFSMVGVTMPHFWLGMLFILLFSLTLKWFPASGYIPFFENPLGNLSRMIMPALAIGAGFAATVMRQTRSAFLEVIDQDYIVTAKAKGLKYRIVIWKHALRNSLIPVITVIAMSTGRLLGGAAISETVFAMPGMGKAIIDSIMSRDYPVAMGLIMFVAMIVILINTLVDVIYILIDPRISHRQKG